MPLRRYETNPQQCAKRRRRNSYGKARMPLWRPSGRSYNRYKKIFRTQSSGQAPNLCMIVRNPRCFPEVLYTDLYYSERVSLDLFSQSLNTWRSSLYDPNQTGTGGQPKWYDQLSQVYRKYEVISMLTEVLVSLTLSDSLPQQVVNLALAPSQLNSTPASFEEGSQAEYGSQATLTPVTSVARLSCYGDVFQLTGFKRGDSQLIANTNASPVVQIAATLCSYCSMSVTTPAIVNIRIRFRAKFMDMYETTS